MNRSSVENVPKDDPHDLLAIRLSLTRHQFMKDHSARPNPSRFGRVLSASFLPFVDGVREELPPDHDGLCHVERTHRLLDGGVLQLGNQQCCSGFSGMFFS